MSEITEELALTAMCVWEELLSILTSNESSNAYVKRQEEVGACEMRSLALHVLAPAVEAAYNAVQQEYQEPFDWEFVPAFLKHAEPILSFGLWAITTDDAVRIGQTIVAEKSAGVANG